MSDTAVSRETPPFAFGPEVWCGDHVAPYLTDDGMSAGYGTATIKLVHEAGGQAGVDVADQDATRDMIAARSPLCCFVGLSVVARIRAETIGRLADGA